jgi:hypothetical protein
MNGDYIKAAIEAKGYEIEELKAAIFSCENMVDPNNSCPQFQDYVIVAMKEDLEPLVAELLALKVSYKEVTGLDFDPSKASNDEGEVKS